MSISIELLREIADGVRRNFCSPDGDRIDDAADEIEALRARVAELEKDADHKQSVIDELMLEYCPSEMTKEQLDRWCECQQQSAIEQQKGGV